MPVVVAEGDITHNDKPQLAAALPQGDHEALVAQAARTYVDWWLLSQARPCAVCWIPGFDAPRFVQQKQRSHQTGNRITVEATKRLPPLLAPL